MTKTPLLLVGDGPAEPTGLGRILRDLGTLLVQSDLPIDLASVGGPVPPVWRAWPHYPLDERLHRGEDWGASYVEQLWASHFGSRPGILWVIWDPSRLVYYQHLQAPVVKWAYPAIDAANGVGTIGGPAGEALASWDRVIAYGRWASQIIKTVRTEAVPYLPHGLYIQTLGKLKDRGLPVYGWLHTDTLVKAWAIPQLVEDCGLAKRVTVSTRAYTDAELAALYRACDVTIAPGLGEGFAYPIAESLASGTLVVHGDYAGGRELVPKREWRFPVRELRLEGLYAVQRPVFRAEDVANAVERALAWRDAVGRETASSYCTGAVAHLDWQALAGRWLAWVKAGL